MELVLADPQRYLDRYRGRRDNVSEGVPAVNISDGLELPDPDRDVGAAISSLLRLQMDPCHSLRLGGDSHAEAGRETLGH